ncbi:RNA polymerase subunit sigma-70 [Sporanaerobium hydrogeniformans]|uniref:RNA polymerase subunit sigma-70 n=1 Tax=Sporanaerobium hydrogeniformans TaxID=3072179 RepID=A0AC61DCD5_9FIRM|nr:RNA polymerase sigma factor [Sporanaerobium hydrogeniformans]PHV70408.1 RNA polymerase subunit sigma-70 [Sporanaerobium hydrogeniformans]
METELIHYILTHKELHYRLAYSYTRNKEDALDIVQDSIVKAIHYQNTLKSKEALHPWFCRILINTAKTFLKKQKHFIPLDEVSPEKLPSHSEKPTYNLLLEEALNHLSYNEKTIIFLRYIEDLELREIAKLLHQNLSTVKSTLYRTQRKLQLLLEKD